MPEKGKTLYASLIGLNQYEGGVKPLYGCINDVLKIDALLRVFCEQKKEPIEYKPLYLLSPDEAGNKELEKYRNSMDLNLTYSAPTFQNVSQLAFAHMEKAIDEKKDLCLLYFSGHGGTTTDVPPGFKTGKIETLVCQDSRSNARDLRDKEISFLLHRVLDKKSMVHCLVIMDCCHSGGMTRGEYEGYRSIDYSDKGAKLKEYLGFKEGFYKVTGGQLVFPIADYVHLAACSADQKAIDSSDGGYFTKALVDMLIKDGRASYRQITKKLNASFTVYNNRQTPIVHSREDWKLDREFLGEGLVSIKRTFELRYNRERGRWQLNAGSIHGLVPSKDGSRTRIRVDGTNIEGELTVVELARSIVSGDDLNQLDIFDDSHSASLIALAIQPITMGISRLNEAMKRELAQAKENHNCLFVKFLADSSKNCSFQIIAKNNGFSLEQHPCISPRGDAIEFLEIIESVARYSYFRSLIGDPSGFNLMDFEFTVEAIEGKLIRNSRSLSRVKGKVSIIHPNATLCLNYINNRQPAFRFSIRLRENSNRIDCFVSALYFSSEFGIYDNFLANVSLSFENPLAHLNYFNTENSLIHAIPLKVNTAFSEKGIECVDECLKIIISDRPLDLSIISQPDLILNNRNVMRSSKGKKRSKIREQAITKDFFETFVVYDFPIRLCRQIAV
ncbi:caspase family protein [uncultured Algoriphagus sp.]|uniref:caspase family protein n=1 Tax=uncultured Algoriphagus sp. TaxID=417365 RepID=UPI0030ED953B|tara:strand:- start:21268 stop:23286 length:2019 start_codon:yes stop_codon:yes gene_type:complete